jgi:D-beta-D-heptose 7-phosphate kinase/D-beta-D-heptose 1-phosphate adenosyltransferase
MKVAVFGDLILDHYLIGTSTRLSPEAPVPVVNVIENKYLLGGACNVVRNLRAFGVEVSVFGTLGNDVEGDIVLSLLNEIKADINGIFRSDRQTTVKTRVQVGNQQIVRLDREITKFIDQDIVESIICEFLLNIGNYNIILLSDYSKGFLSDSMIDKIIEVANYKGITIIVDPKGVNFRRYEGVHFLTPNKVEAELATGIRIEDENSLKSVLNSIKELINSNVGIVTLGAEGIAFSDDDGVTVFPALASEVYDVTGAGDTVISALAYGLCNNWSLKESVIFANKAASIVVRKLGSATASLDEINELFYE